MKIDGVSGYPVYRQSGSASAAKSSATDTTGKTDVVDFSRGQTAAPDKSLLTLESALLRDIAQPASPERLAALKSSIQQGCYHPSTDAIVAAILGRDE